MRRFKVEISHKGKLVHSREIVAVDEGDAKDHAWEGFDPGHEISILDQDYTTSIEEI